MSAMLQRIENQRCFIGGVAVTWSPVREAARLISLRGALWRDIRHAADEEELYAGRPILTGLQRLPWGRLDRLHREP